MKIDLGFIIPLIHLNKVNEVSTPWICPISESVHKIDVTRNFWFIRPFTLRISCLPLLVWPKGDSKIFYKTQPTLGVKCVNEDHFRESF